MDNFIIYHNRLKKIVPNIFRAKFSPRIKSLKLLFFFNRKTENFHDVKDKYIASWNTRDSIIGGLSSNQVTKPWIPFACCVKACADLFPCRLTCWTLMRLNSCNFCWMLSRTSITVAGGMVKPDRAVKISFKNNFLYANIPCKRNRYVHRLCFSLQGTQRQVQMLTESCDDRSCMVPNQWYFSFLNSRFNEPFLQVT